jgi:hypothetical protein
VKRAAALAAVLIGLVAVIVLVAMAALWASGALSESVPGRATPAPVPATAQPVDVTSYVGQHADIVSAGLRQHGFTSVTYRTNGGEIPFGTGCTPFTVVDEVYTQLPTKSAIITTHITDLDAMAQWLRSIDTSAWDSRCTVPAVI